MIKGDKFNHTFLVSEKVYLGFIDLFKDKNPLHTSFEFAISKGFSEKVMHGNILGGFLSYFIGELLPIKNVIIHTQEIKYLNPVYINSQLVFMAEVIDVIESVNVVQFVFLFENQQNQKVAKGKIQIGILK